MPRQSQGSNLKPLLFEPTRPPLVSCTRLSSSPLAIYELLKAFSNRDPESIVELVIPNDRGMLKDLSVWCHRTGCVLISSEVTDAAGLKVREVGEVGELGTDEERNESMDVLRCLVQKALDGGRRMSMGSRAQEPLGKEGRMAVVFSTSNLAHLGHCFDKALSGALLGLEVNLFFEFSGIKLLQRGYKPRVDGWLRRWRTSGSDSEKIGRSIEALDDLGATFWVSGKLEEDGEDWAVKRVERGGSIAMVDLLGRSEVCVFSGT